MRILREKRLKQELMNGADIFELRDKLYQEKEWMLDNDRLVQAIDINKDIKIVEEWIFNDEELSMIYNEMMEDKLNELNN